MMIQIPVLQNRTKNQSTRNRPKHQLGRLVSVLSIVASIAVMGVSTQSVMAQDCESGCDDGELPTPATITATWKTKTEYPESDGPCAESEAEGTTVVCGLPLTGGISLTGSSYNDCLESGSESSDLCVGVTFTIDPDGTWDILLTTSACEPGTGTPPRQLGEGSEKGDLPGSCRSVTYSYSDGGGYSEELTITISGGDCVPAPEDGSDPCSSIEDGGDDEDGCEDDETISQKGNVSNTTTDSVALLTGHKIEKSTDLTVQLPGRNFDLKREYSSDPNLFASNSSGQYFWRGQSSDVIPGPVGVNWTTNVFRSLTGSGSVGSNLYLNGVPLRTTRVFEYDDDDGNGPVRYLPRSSSSQYVYETTVDVPGFGSEQVYRLREPGGKECDFAKMPSNLPTGNNGLGLEDFAGLPIFERDEYGNTWYYEYAIIKDNGLSPRDSAVLTSIYLNWDDAGTPANAADDTWAARVDFLWNGLTDHPNIANDGSGSDDPALNPYKSITQLDGSSNPNHHFGRMAEVRVVRPDGVGETQTQGVRYMYYEDIKDRINPEDVNQTQTLDDIRFDGSSGDLCQVIKSTLVDADEGEPTDGFYEQVWQYRYYSGDFYQDTITNNWPGHTSNLDFEGEDHQLLAVFYPEQIEFFADHYAQKSIASGVGTRTTPFVSVTEAADQLLWVLFDDYANEQYNLGTDWEDYILPNEHWGALFDIASKMITYEDGFDGYRVKTQFVNAGDGSSACGCGGSGSSTGGFRLGKRFDYLYKRFNWTAIPDGMPSDDPRIPNPETNGYSCQIIESHAGVVGTYPNITVGYSPYRVRAHDYYWPTEHAVGEIHGRKHSGVAWKVASSLSEANVGWNFSSGGSSANDNPFDTSVGARRWVTLYEYSTDGVSSGSGVNFNSYHKVTRQITPSANDWTQYVPSTDENSSTTSVTLPPVHDDKGLIYDMDYVGSWPASKGFKKGGLGVRVEPTKRTFATGGRPDLVSKIQRFPGEGPTGDTPIETTEITYGYHNGGLLGTDPNGLIIAWKKIEMTAETAAQNGPASATKYTSYQMFDTKGQLRWSQDPDGALTYYGYDEATGAMNKTVQDALYNGSYVSSDAALPSAFPGLSWSAPSGWTPEELQSEYGIDLLGRVISSTDASGNTRYTRYEVKTTDNVVADGTLKARGVPYFASVNLPYQLSDNSFDGPVSVSWSNAVSKSVRSSLYSVDSASAYTPGDGVFTSIAEVSRSDAELMISGLPMRQRQWHRVGDVSSVGGTSAKPYVNSGSYVTMYEYDPIGRIFTVVDPEDGVTKTTQYDIRDRSLITAVGVRDWTSNPGSDLTENISHVYFDSAQAATQGVGNGTLTYSELHVDTISANDRVVKRWYDYRDRLRGVLNPMAPHSVMEYDELNRVVESANLITNTGFTVGADPDGTLPSAGTGTADRSTYSQALYNNRGMVYRSRTAIDPTLAAGTTFLESNRWFDEEGNLLASWSPNSGATKYEYDGLDRPTVVYQTDRAGDSLISAGSVVSDHVISQTEYSYIPDDQPGAGAAFLTTQRMRHHDAIESGTGEVLGALTGTTSVTTYSATVRDEAGRVTDSLQYGTNSASGFVSSTSAPTAPFDTSRITSDALISSVGFDSWGRVRESIDPEGKSTVTKFDDMSRSVAMIESSVGVAESQIAWNAASEEWQVTWPVGAPADQDRVTSFVYDGLSNIVKRTAHLNDGSVQVTAYDYDTTAGSSSNTLDTLVGSSSLLQKVHYPNESTGLVDTSAAYTVTYAYNKLGELRGMSDQNGTVHKMTYDQLGRITSDEVDSYASLSTIDPAINEITASFDFHGRISLVESLNVLNAVVNSVGFEYTSLHQIEALVQDVDGAGAIGSERVEYDYSNVVASASGGNYSRISGMRYPSQAAGTTNTVSIDYTGKTGFDVINDRISRVSGYSAPSWGHTGTDDLVHYDYLGQSTPVKVNYTDITMGLDYTKAFDGSEAAGAYPGFDQYGRVVWHAWVHDNFTTGPTTNYPNATPLMARRYAYDKMSNRTFDWDGRPGATVEGRDWEYEYDNLDRMKTANRGLRNDFVSPTSLTTIADNSRQWNLDMLGNWNNVITDIDGDGLFEAGTETEDRTFNSANELATREGPVGSGVTFSPVYDDAGNYRSNGSSGSEDLIYTHDAWNRLVKIERDVGGVKSPVLENTFNGLNWRVTRKVDLAKGGYDGTLDEERRYYYSAGWQMIEEHVDNDLDNAIDYKSQQVWGVRYIDDAVAKKINRDNDNDWDDDAKSEFYYLTDAMFSVRALLNNGGAVTERIDYTPYGVAMHRYASDINEDGLIDFFDVGDFLAAYAITDPGAPGYDPDADSSGDGLNFFDVGDFLENHAEHAGSVPDADVPDGWISNPGFGNDADNSIGYDGYAFDFAGATDGTTSGVYMVRHRVYGSGFDGWLERDPMPYNDGSGQYQYCVSSPLVYYDYDGQQPRTRIFLNDAKTLFIELDVFTTKGVTSFEFHVYETDRAMRSGKREVAKINARGAWSRTHRGCNLLLPEEFKKKYGGPSKNKITRALEKNRGRVRGSGAAGGALSLFFFLDMFSSTADAAEVPFDPTSSGQRCKCKCRLVEEVSFVPNLFQSWTAESTTNLITTCTGLENGYMEYLDCQGMTRPITSEKLLDNMSGKVYLTTWLVCDVDLDDCCD